MAAGLSGTFVTNGSPTKTQILDQQHGRTQVANITMAAVVLLFALFFTGLLTNMPKATLTTYNVVGEASPTRIFPRIGQGIAAFEADQGAARQ